MNLPNLSGPAFPKSRTLAGALASLMVIVSASACGQGGTQAELDALAGRVRAQPVASAIALVPPDYQFATPGQFTVAHAVGQLPLADYGPDGRSIYGSEPDIAQLVADSLGLELKLVAVAWPDWPLGLESGRFDAVISNVTVTEERKEKFDFSTYRDDQLGIYTRADSPLGAITRPSDVAGLVVSVGASTNQSQILDRWNAENVAAGLKPVSIKNYDDTAIARLALLSGQVDVTFEPNSTAAYKSTDGKTRKLGSFSGGWPLTAQIAVVTRKGSGLAPAVTEALNAQIANGNHRAALERWNLDSEAITASETNPPGLPKL